MTNHCVQLLACCCLFSSFTQPDIVTFHGTIVAIQIEGDRVVVAAESKRQLGNGPHDFTEKACKIDPMGMDTFFTAAGKVEMEAKHIGKGPYVVVYDAHQLAKKAFAESKGSTARELANYWGELIKAKINPTLKYHPPVTAPTNQLSGAFAQDTFMGLSVYVAEVNINPPTVRGGLPSVVVDLTPLGVNPHQNAEVFGDPPVLDYYFEFVGNQTSRAMEANKELKDAIASDPKSDALALKLKFALAYAIKWDKGQHAVGGAIDILELKRAHGLRWIAVKDECKKSALNAATQN